MIKAMRVTSCHDLAKRLSHYLYFFFFSFLSHWTYNYKVEHGKVSRDFITMSQWCDGGHITVTVCHMTKDNMRTMGEQAHSHSSKVYK